MNDGWETVAIGEICEAIYDGPHATPKKTADGPIFLGISNLQNGQINLSDAEHLSEEDFVRWTRRVTPQENDIVFSYETRLGEAALVPNGLRFCLGRRMALMRPNTSKIVPRFLLYSYLGPEFQQTLRARTVHGSTVDRIPLIEFPTFPISIPPISEQRAIAEILGALDDKTELNRRVNHTLEFTARVVFNKFFLSFEPLNPNRQNIPQGWKHVSMENCCLTVTRGVTPKYSIGSGRPIINQRANRGTELDWSELKELAIDLDVPSEKYARKYDVLVNSLGEGTLGRIHLFLENYSMMAVDQHMSICRTSEPSVSLYIYYLLSGSEGQNRIEAVKTGSTGMTMLNISKLREFDFLLPPENLLSRFAEFAIPIWDKIALNQRESRTLASLRDTLLPKLMRGEVSVKDTEGLGEI